MNEKQYLQKMKFHNSINSFHNYVSYQTMICIALRLEI